MDRYAVLAVTVLVFFSMELHPPLTCAIFNMVQEGHYKSVVATSGTIWVPDNYTRIQWAIGNASGGDTIFVRAGTYYERLTIDKKISLIGENEHNTNIDGNGTGIIIFALASNITVSGFTVQNGECGIWLWQTANNIFTRNIASNNQYGIYAWESNTNILTGNIVSNNQYGIYIWRSSNNILSGNIASNNQYGIYLYYSRNNIVTGNAVTNNQYGIRLDFFCNNNTLTCNNVSSNDNSGIRLTFSSDNMICHNNFIKNIETASSIDSVNSWDNRAEGNYWSDYKGTDADIDGIGDTPYPIGEDNQDGYPLMATFLQFDIAKENQSYKIDAVSNFKISDIHYDLDPDTRTDAVSFRVNDAEGRGFCRIRIAHALIKPPYAVRVDHKSRIPFEIVYTNKTHTWLYFTNDLSGHEVTIMHTLYLEQLVLLQWTILGLTGIIAFLLFVSFKYYRKFKEQKKVIETYQHELGSLPANHSELARLLFAKDVIERKEKIDNFKKKYGIHIQPAGTLEDLMQKMGVKEKVNN